jgi:hypothetical protein
MRSRQWQQHTSIAVWPSLRQHLRNTSLVCFGLSPRACLEMNDTTHTIPPPPRAELSDDPIIRHHLAALYDTLLEQNLMRIIEPYNRVEIGYVAETVKQPVKDVEAKYVLLLPILRIPQKSIIG